MESVLAYGQQSEVRLDLAAENLVGDCAAPRGTPLDDVPAAVAAALCDPLEFPPLAKCVVPGDQVVLALGEPLPQTTAIIGQIVRALIEAGVEPQRITLLRTEEEVLHTQLDPLAELPEAVAAAIQRVQHQPGVRDELAYLAASHGGEPIYLNRHLVEADLVLPISCARCEATAGYYGPLGTLCPTFADEKTQHRFRSLRVLGLTGETDTRSQEWIREVGWLLGVQMSVQIVPGAGDQVLQVVAGMTDAVARRSEQICQAAWSYQAPRKASLVVATIAGNQSEQTWVNLARAVATAAQVVEEHGAIVVCTELDEAPGRGLQSLAGRDDLDEALREINQVRPEDTLVATQMARALEDARIFLLSRLPAEAVEELGIIPVATAEEVSRLVHRHPSCILLPNAHRITAEPLPA